jgi:hypothetical protein
MLTGLLYFSSSQGMEREMFRQELESFKATSRKQLEYAKSLMDTAVDVLTRKLEAKADATALSTLDDELSARLRVSSAAMAVR